MRSEKDLIDIGIKLLPARSMLLRIDEWKTSGLPEDFVSLFNPGPSDSDVTECRAQTYQAYYEARFCGSESAFESIQQRAHDGDLLAEAYLGALFALRSNRCVPDLEKSELCMNKVKAFLQKEAETGCQYAQHMYGFIHSHGIGVRKDEQMAVKFYKLAGKQGNNPTALTALGKAYANGNWVRKSKRKAIRYYARAAELKHALAQCSLGWCYATGWAVRTDLRKAVQYYQLAADQGHADAQGNLAVCYQNGTGVAKNEQEAVKYYKLAAQQRQSTAQNNLGMLYATGEGVDKDEKQAVHYFKMAADQGLSFAQYNLATCYANGTGVTQDKQEAARYFQLVADQQGSGVGVGAEDQMVDCAGCWVAQRLW